MVLRHYANVDRYTITLRSDEMPNNISQQQDILFRYTSGRRQISLFVTYTSPTPFQPSSQTYIRLYYNYALGVPTERLCLYSALRPLTHYEWPPCRSSPQGFQPSPICILKFKILNYTICGTPVREEKMYETFFI